MLSRDAPDRSPRESGADGGGWRGREPTSRRGAGDRSAHGANSPKSARVSLPAEVALSGWSTISRPISPRPYRLRSGGGGWPIPNAFYSSVPSCDQLQPHELHSSAKIEAAKRLLLQTSRALLDIALTVGFQTQATSRPCSNGSSARPRRWRRAQLAEWPQDKGRLRRCGHPIGPRTPAADFD